MSEAILEMTTKGFGCVGVTDARGLLVGIITDGDLRRHMRDNLLDARVDDVMTRAPKTVRPDQLLSETLDILNVMKVTALFAVESRQTGRRHPRARLAAGGYSVKQISSNDFCDRIDDSIDRWRHTIVAENRQSVRLPTGPVRLGLLPAKIATRRDTERGGKMQQPGVNADDVLRPGNQFRDLI